MLRLLVHKHQSILHSLPIIDCLSLMPFSLAIGLSNQTQTAHFLIRSLLAWILLGTPNSPHIQPRAAMSHSPFHLGWFMNFTAGDWDSDFAVGGAPWDGKFYIDMAQALERACFDYIMLE